MKILLFLIFIAGSTINAMEEFGLEFFPEAYGAEQNNSVESAQAADIDSLCGVFANLDVEMLDSLDGSESEESSESDSENFFDFSTRIYAVSSCVLIEYAGERVSGKKIKRKPNHFEHSAKKHKVH